MQIRVCDRCGVTVASSPASLQVLVPIEDPATRQAQVTAEPFVAALQLQIVAMVPGQTVDLCPVCYASTLVELAILLLTGLGLGAGKIRTLEKRIETLVGV